MKTLFKISLTLIAIVSLVACKNGSKDSTTGNSQKEVAKTAALAFNDASVQAQFQHYIHLKTALVNSDVEEAHSGAQMLIDNTDDAALKNMLVKIVETGDIETQRTVFSDVTEKVTALVNESITNGEVYRQFCPMAFNNEGGYWLSTEKEIRNPYFGDKMLQCGKVAETIK